MSSSSGAGSSIFKWQIAFGLGAVGALGLAYWYLRASRKHSFHNARAISIDETGNDIADEPETDFQRAQKLKNDGNIMYKKGKYDEAINLYNQAIEIIPDEYKNDLAIFYQNRAAAYEELKKYSAVVADCSKAIELNGKYEKALMRRARVLEILKDLEGALDDITAVCILQNFGNQNALLMADRILKELGKKNAADAMKNKVPVIPSTSFIKTYFSSFSEDPVYNMLLEVGEPLGLGALKGFLKAKLAFATEKYEEIIPTCTEELSLSESESDYYIEALSLRASFYFLTGQFKEAEEDFTRIIEAKDAKTAIKVNALIKRASIYMQTEKLEECLADFDKAAELGPNNSDVFHHRGQVKLLMDKIDEAQADFHKSVSLNPNFAIAFVQKCYADYRQAMQAKNFELMTESLADFRKAIEKFPTCSETYILYAQVQTEKQDYQDAEKLFKKALKIDPKNASIYVHRGLLLLQWKGEIENAVKLIREGIEVDEKCQFAYETLGTVEVQRGNLVIAIDLFNKAIELARSEMEMVHLFSLRDAAASQLKVATRLGIGPSFLSTK